MEDLDEKFRKLNKDVISCENDLNYKRLSRYKATKKIRLIKQDFSCLRNDWHQLCHEMSANINIIIRNDNNIKERIDVLEHGLTHTRTTTLQIHHSLHLTLHETILVFQCQLNTTRSLEE